MVHAGKGDLDCAHVIAGEVVDGDTEVALLLDGGAYLEVRGDAGTFAYTFQVVSVFVGGEIDVDGLAGEVEDFPVGVVEIGGELDSAFVGAVGLGKKGEG